MDHRSSVTNSLRFTLLLGLLVVGLVWVISYDTWVEATNSFQTETETEFNRRFTIVEDELHHTLDQAIRLSFDIANSSALHKAVSRSTTYENLLGELLVRRDWISSLKLYSSVDQIRFIAEGGNELFKAYRRGRQIKWEEEEGLQFKGTRHYFQEAKRSHSPQWISSIDLNEEYGQVEQPLKPVVRAMAPVYAEDVRLGFVVINYDLSKMFEKFAEVDSHSPMWIMNSGGYFLYSPIPEQTWGWQLGHPEMNAKQLFPEVWASYQHLRNDRTGQWKTTGDLGVSNLWYRIIYPRSTYSAAEYQSPEYLLFATVPETFISKLNRTKLLIFSFAASFTLIAVVVFLYILRGAREIGRYHAETADALERAKVSEQSKVQFFSRMSHEIRTPLNGIYGFLQLINEHPQVQSNSSVKKYLHEALYSYSILAQVINDLLDFSKLEAGKMTLVKQSFLFDEMMQSIGQMMGRLAVDKPIDLWFDIDPKRPSVVVGDKIRLSQILINLSNNSIKFTKQGEVRIKTAVLDRTEDEVQIAFEVIDTGIGMTPEQIDKIFTPYTQASDETFQSYGGTGLGMAIAKQFIEMMRGSIEIDSIPGEGTTVRFNVWLGLDPVVEASTSDRRTERLVDIAMLSDDIAAYELLKRQCMLFGWSSRKLGGQDLDQLTPLDTGSDATRVLIIDDKMIADEKSATRLLQEINLRLKSLPPVLVLCSQSSALNADIYKQFGNIRLTRPFTPTELNERIHAACVDMRGAETFESETPDKTGQPEKDLRLAGMHILLAEDNRVNQIVAVEILQAEGAIITLANDGQEAVERVEQAGDTPFNLILMDMHMPVMDGIEATGRIKQLGMAGETPVVGLTANATEDDRRICMEAGMLERLAKPYKREDLVSMVLLFAK